MLLLDQWMELSRSVISFVLKLCFFLSLYPHQVYSETVIPRLAKAAQEVTGMPQEELMESFGVTFVSYVSRYGYDKYAFAIVSPLHLP